MYQITDPDNVLYYVEYNTPSGCVTIDPLRPFTTEDEAVKYAIDEMGLSVLDFSIIEWKVD